MKLIKKWNKSGFSYIFACVLIMVMMVVFSGIIYYYKIINYVDQSKQKMSLWLDSYMTEYMISHMDYFTSGKGYNEEELLNGCYAAIGTSEGGTKQFEIGSGNSKQTLEITDIRLTAITGKQVGVRLEGVLLIPTAFLNNKINIGIKIVIKSRVVSLR